MNREILYPIAIWVGMAGIAILNGITRELFIVPRIGDYPGHVLSTLFLSVVILLIVYLFFSHASVSYSKNQLLAIGVAWSCLTIIFEFIVGFLEGTPTVAIVAQYNVFAGSVWILVPITLLFAPLLFGSLTDN